MEVLADSATVVTITVGSLTFSARLEEEAAPATCALFSEMLPLRAQLIQARWSGEAAWIPFGDLGIELPGENELTQPEKGQILFFPGGISETEVLIPYGESRFACRAGPLAGNHFMTIIEGEENLPLLGRHVLWNGAQEIAFELANVPVGGALKYD